MVKEGTLSLDLEKRVGVCWREKKRGFPAEDVDIQRQGCLRGVVCLGDGGFPGVRAIAGCESPALFWGGDSVPHVMNRCCGLGR